MTQGLGVTNPTAPGPMLNFPEPKLCLVAVGRLNDGPMPQMNAPRAAGEK
jgi:hypothetical protein